MLSKIQEARDFITSRVSVHPRVGIITGTGLGDLTASMRIEKRFPYEGIPHFSRSTAMGHRGTLALGSFQGVPIVAMEGRFHLYEGYSAEEVTFPVRVMSRLGTEVLIISSAAGGLHPLLRPADLMMVTDHMNLTGRNPLIGPNLETFGPRFPDMSRAYDRGLMELAREKALAMRIALKEGVYVGILGPSLETPAETRYLRSIGADAVGMSTVLEVITAVHCGLRVLAIMAISNVNLPDCMAEASIEEIVATAERAGKRLSILLEAIIASI